MLLNPRTALILALIGLSGAVAQAGDPSGLWWTEDDKGKMRVYRCGEAYCAEVVELSEPLDEETGKPRLDKANPDPELRDRPVVGLNVLRIPAEPDSKGVLRNGRIYDPESGKTYKCIVWEDGGLLKLKGYVGIPLLGRKTEWRRADP